MLYPIVRLYANSQDAEAAVAKVLASGLPRERVNLVTPSSAASEDGIVRCIAAGLVLTAQARAYAPAVRGGQYLVSVSAPGGTGVMYTALLESCHPVGGGIGERTQGRQWEEAAPFSSIFGLPVISPPSPYDFLGFPAVDRTGRTTSSSWGLPEIASSHFSLFGNQDISQDFAIFGNPNVSGNPSPLSSLFHIPVIAGSRD